MRAAATSRALGRTLVAAATARYCFVDGTAPKCDAGADGGSEYRTLSAHGIPVPVGHSSSSRRSRSREQQGQHPPPLRPTVHAKFVIIGDGVAGRSALETLRGRGVPASKVLVLGGKDGPSSRAASLDTERSLVICEDGETIVSFDRCLIACGSEPPPSAAPSSSGGSGGSGGSGVTAVTGAG